MAYWFVPYKYIIHSICINKYIITIHNIIHLHLCFYGLVVSHSGIFLMFSFVQNSIIIFNLFNMFVNIFGLCFIMCCVVFCVCLLCCVLFVFCCVCVVYLFYLCIWYAVTFMCKLPSMERIHFMTSAIIYKRFY